MDHLDILKQAYDSCGMVYVVRAGNPTFSYLFLCDKSKKQYFEETDLDRLCMLERFFEFQNGQIVSY